MSEYRGKLIRFHDDSGNFITKYNPRTSTYDGVRKLLEEAATKGRITNQNLRFKLDQLALHAGRETAGSSDLAIDVALEALLNRESGLVLEGSRSLMNDLNRAPENEEFKYELKIAQYEDALTQLAAQRETIEKIYESARGLAA